MWRAIRLKRAVGKKSPQLSLDRSIDNSNSLLSRPSSRVLPSRISRLVTRQVRRSPTGHVLCCSNCLNADRSGQYSIIEFQWILFMPSVNTWLTPFGQIVLRVESASFSWFFWFPLLVISGFLISGRDSSASGKRHRTSVSPNLLLKLHLFPISFVSISFVAECLGVQPSLAKRKQNYSSLLAFCPP